MGNKYLDGTALTIVIIGAINWLLIGLFRFDLVALLFGEMSWLSRVIYTLVGICGLYLISFYMHLGSRDDVAREELGNQKTPDMISHIPGVLHNYYIVFYYGLTTLQQESAFHPSRCVPDHIKVCFLCQKYAQ